MRQRERLFERYIFGADDFLLEARVRPDAWKLLPGNIWVNVLLECRVRPDAWKLLPVNIWVDVLLEARLQTLII